MNSMADNPRFMCSIIDLIIFFYEFKFYKYINLLFIILKSMMDNFTEIFKRTQTFRIDLWYNKPNYATPFQAAL
jgi:hypothetical protein